MKLKELVKNKLQEYATLKKDEGMTEQEKLLFDTLTDVYSHVSVPHVLTERKAKMKVKSKIFKTPEEFEAITNYYKATLFNNPKAIEYLNDLSGGTSPGSYFVPSIVAPTLVELIERYGVASRYANKIIMGARQETHPVPTGLPTASMVDENSSITASDPTWTQANLVAKKAAVLVKISSELNEDSIENMVDTITTLAARAIAYREDLNVFLGDGTSSYGGFTGLANALQAGAIVTSATGNTSFDTLDFDDFEEVVAVSPAYIENPVWFISKYGFNKSMRRLMNAAGGASISDLARGLTEPYFMGYPVVYTEVLPSAGDTTAGKIVAYFGDMKYAVALGIMPSELSMKVSTDRYFETDQIGIKVTERHAVDVFGTGDASDADGIVALKCSAT